MVHNYQPTSATNAVNAGSSAVKTKSARSEPISVDAHDAFRDGATRFLRVAIATKIHMN